MTKKCTKAKRHKWSVVKKDNDWDYLLCIKCRLTTVRRGGRR